MRREHSSKSGGYIDWLKSLGCIMYLPLSEEGDLLDRISGLSLQLTGNGNMVWDSSEGKYKITTPSSALQKVAVLNNGLTSQSFPENQFSVLYTIKKITSSSKYIRGLSVNSTASGTTDALNPLYNASSRSSGYPSTETKVAGVINGNVDRKYYQNGALYNSYASYSPLLPSNWTLDGSGLFLGQAQDSNSVSVELYINEIYLFNTALDLTTIRKIQGYE